MANIKNKSDNNPSFQEIKEDYLRLKESESRYKRQIEVSPDISYIFGTKTGAKFWSPQVRDILGIEPDTLLKDPFAWTKAIHPDDQKKVDDLFKSLDKTSAFSLEYRVKDKHGNWRWLRDRTVSVQNINDEFVIEGLAQDITEHKKVEQELKASEEKFRKAFMTSPDAININRLDDGLYISINPGFTRIMGYQEKDAVGKSSLELNIWKKQEDRQKLIDGLRKNGNVENMEAEFIAKDGTARYGLMSASIITLEDIPHILSITRDITDRVSIKEKFEKNSYFLEKSQEIGKMGTWEIDLTTNAIFVTEQVYKIFELSPDAHLDIKLYSAFIHPDDKEKVLDLWNRALKGSPYVIEHRIIINNKVKWVREIADIDVGHSVSSGTVVGTIQDITARKNIEEALEKSEEKYRLIVENANDGIEITQNNRIIYSNNKFADLLGYNKEELQDVLFENIFSKKAQKDLSERTKKREQGEELPSLYETTFLRRDGTEIIVEVNYQIIEYKNKPATFAIIRDITQSRKMEEELSKLSTAVDQSPSIIAITNVQGEIEYVNPRFSEVTGYTLSEVKGKTPRILKSGILPEKTYKLLWDTIASGETWRGEFHNKRKNGEMYWENAAVSPIKNKHGDITNFLKVAEDITEWKDIEEALRHSEEQYRLIVENANDGILISQKDEFIYKNSRFIDMLGYDHDEFEKITFKEIYTKEGLADLQSRYLKREAGVKIPSYYETTFRKKDGSIISVDVNYQIINYHNQEATFAIVRDISEKKESEIALKKALNRAEESDRLKSAFLANMSHEIRTPMNGIIGFTNLLKNPKLGDEKKDQYLDIIEKSGQRLLNIINDLIDISKIEAQQIEIKKTYFNLNEVITFMDQFFEPECKTKNIYLKTDTPDQSINLFSDKDKLEAVMINLLKNAVKFTSEGGITFGFKIEERSITFFVKDTGIGIPEEKQQTIFDRFIQVDNSVSKPYEGAGLGLSISSAYVDMLGGKLDLESSLHQGSTFYFSIPYKAQKNLMLNMDKPLQYLETDKKENISNLKILIAEDDEFSFQFLDILLQPYSNCILHAKNGQEAIEICRNNPDTDLILMDIKMPVLDGNQATKTIRRFNQGVTIIAQTAYAFIDDHKKFLDSGFNGYLTKPIKENDLKLLLKKQFIDE
jgi:PAS domain S-box-containing protein